MASGMATSAWVCLSIFFWFAWPETFLQTVHGLDQFFWLPWLGPRQQKSAQVGITDTATEGGSSGAAQGVSGMGLWELSLGSGTVKLADWSLTCSPDFCGMHRNSWRLLGLWAGTQQYDRLGSRRWGGEEVKVGEDEWVFGKGICSDWCGLHLDVRST